MIFRSWRGPLALVGAGVAAGVVCLAAGMGWMITKPMAEDYQHRQQFEKTAWKLDQGNDREWPTRLTMATDLVASRLLVGKTREQIVDLLGPQTQTDKWKDWSLVYWLGPERGLIRIDSEWLVIRIDENGRAREVRLVRD